MNKLIAFMVSVVMTGAAFFGGDDAFCVGYSVENALDDYRINLGS